MQTESSRIMNHELGRIPNESRSSHQHPKRRKSSHLTQLSVISSFSLEAIVGIDVANYNIVVLNRFLKFFQNPRYKVTLVSDDHHTKQGGFIAERTGLSIKKTSGRAVLKRM